jgi:hypothetical protein
MKSSPGIAALQADPGLQRAAQQGLVSALADWQAGPRVSSVLEQFARYAAGCDLADAGPLAELFGGNQAQAARTFIAPLIAAWTAALTRQPFGIATLRHVAGKVSSSLLLAAERDAILTLVALDGAALAAAPAASSASFASGEVWEVIIAGSGQGHLIERNGETLTQHAIDLEPGLSLGRNSDREALLIDRVEGTLVLLRLQRRNNNTEPRREFALDDGRLLRQASASPAESRHEVAVTLLGRMGRKDAVPVLAELARDESHGTSLRWQAMRECLGLDSRTGFCTLSEIARGDGDPLALPAGALRAQLLETYPQLAEIDLCRV